MNPIEEAARRLRGGGVVAIPTETVYGLAADARQRSAVERVYAIKGRPLDHPVIVHIASLEQVGEWARQFPAPARELAERYWPGPLTLILPRRPEVGDWITGGQDTVGLRVPRHPLTRQLLELLNTGLAAPSANRFGRVSPTCPEHVRADLGDDVEMILDGGPCEVGLESTIVDCSGASLRVLRPGQLHLALPQGQGPRAPGTLASHYAPRTPTRWWEGERLDGQDGWLGFALSDSGAGFRELLPADVEGAGQGLYAALRRLDTSGARTIYIQPPPPGPDWEAVRDRLQRACTPA